MSATKYLKLWLGLRLTLAATALTLTACGGGDSAGSEASGSISAGAPVCGVGSVSSASSTSLASSHGWSTAVKLSNSPPFLLEYVGGTADSRGNVLLSWRESLTSGGPYYLYAARYDVLSNIWRQSAQVATLSGSALLPSLISGMNGNAVLAWADRSSIYAARYDSGSDSWDKPVNVNVAGTDFVFFTTAASANGDVVIAWRQQVSAGSSARHLYAAS